MSILDTLITDRTQADVNRIKNIMQKGLPRMTAEEIMYFIKGQLEALDDSTADALVDSNGVTIGCRDGVLPKGSYNYTDLNRVNGAVNYIASRYNEIGYIFRDDGGILFSDRKVVWESSEIPTTDDMTDYLHWVKAIRDFMAGNVDTEIYWLPEDMDRIDYEDANAIERALRFVDGMIDRIKAGWYFSGELYGGEV